MKRILWSLLLAVLTLPLTAEERIATVNMETVFRQYFKSRIAADTLRRQSEVYRTYVVAEQDKMRALEREIAVARDAAQNLALTQEKREEQQKICSSGERDLAARKVALNRYMLERNQTLSRIEKEKRAEILGDIRREAARQAAIAGYAYVLDASGMTTSGVPAVIYAHPGADLTEKILKVLNAAAQPAGEKK